MTTESSPQAARWRTRLRPILGARKHRALMFWHLARQLARLRHRRRSELRRRSERERWIAIGQVEHLGDIAACEPVIAWLRREQPQARLFWCVRAPYRELLATHPDVDEVLVVTCLSEWMRLSRSGIFDAVIDLHLPRRVCPICREPLQKAVGADSDTRITLDNYYHFGTLLEIHCRSAGLPVPDEPPRVFIPASAAARVDALRLPSSFVAVHCSSNETTRDWTSAKWHQLARRILHDAKLSVVEVGTAPILSELESESTAGAPGAAAGYVNACGQTSILETAEIIRRARCFVGVDSGPAHLANAVGTFGIILLGTYRAFDRYLPYNGGYGDGSNARILHADGPASALEVEPVYQALSETLA